MNPHVFRLTATALFSAIGLTACGEPDIPPPAVEVAKSAALDYFERHPEAMCAGQFIPVIRLNQEQDKKAYAAYQAHADQGVYSAQVIYAGTAEFLLSQESLSVMKKIEGRYCLPLSLESPLAITNVGKVESRNGLLVTVINYAITPVNLPAWASAIPAELLEPDFKSDMSRITGSLPLVKTEYGTWEVGLL